MNNFLFCLSSRGLRPFLIYSLISFWVSIIRGILIYFLQYIMQYLCSEVSGRNKGNCFRIWMFKLFVFQRKVKFFNSIGKYFQTKSTTTCIDPRYLRKFISVPAQIMKHKQQLNRYVIFCKIYNIVAKHQKLVPIMIYFCKQELLGAVNLLG